MKKQNPVGRAHDDGRVTWYDPIPEGGAYIYAAPVTALDHFAADVEAAFANEVQTGMDWYNGCSEAERARWHAAAGSAVPADAYRAFSEQSARAGAPAAPAAVAGPAEPTGWREQFAAAVYDDLAAADNQDVPLEEYPARILKVLDVVVGPRHPAIVKWRNDAIQACAAIAYRYCRDPESHQYLKQDLQALITAAPAQAAPAALATPDERAAFDAWFIQANGFDPRTDTTMRSDAWEPWKAWKARAALAAAPQAPAETQEPYCWHYWNNGGTSVYHRGPSKMLDADRAAAAEYPKVHHCIPLYTHPAPQQAAPQAPAAPVEMSGSFVEWFTKNYPRDTIIVDPAWHAQSIFRMAQAHARLAAGAAPAAPAVDARDAVPVMLGKKLFYFDCHQDWVNQAHRIWRLFGVRPEQTICLDQKGRVLQKGLEFARADKEGAFPVDVYLALVDDTAAHDAWLAAQAAAEEGGEAAPAVDATDTFSRVPPQSYFDERDALALLVPRAQALADMVDAREAAIAAQAAAKGAV